MLWITEEKYFYGYWTLVYTSLWRITYVIERTCSWVFAIVTFRSKSLCTFFSFWCLKTEFFSHRNPWIPIFNVAHRFCWYLVPIKANRMNPVDRDVEKLRALLAVNSSAGIFPKLRMCNPEFPDVDCNEVFPHLYLGNG